MRATNRLEGATPQPIDLTADYHILHSYLNTRPLLFSHVVMAP